MLDKARLSVLGAALTLAAGVACVVAAAPPSPQSQKEALMRAFQAGNYKDAYEGLRKRALDPADDPKQVSGDLTTAVQCLQQLGRTDEVDDFREGVIAAHKGNWRLLETAAQTYAQGEHFGFIIAGKFHRGGHRGGGRMVNSQQRDRVRALQLMQQALPLTKDETDRSAL